MPRESRHLPAAAVERAIEHENHVLVAPQDSELQIHRLASAAPRRWFPRYLSHAPSGGLAPPDSSIAFKTLSRARRISSMTSSIECTRWRE